MLQQQARRADLPDEDKAAELQSKRVANITKHLCPARSAPWILQYTVKLQPPRHASSDYNCRA